MQVQADSQEELDVLVADVSEHAHFSHQVSVLLSGGELRMDHDTAMPVPTVGGEREREGGEGEREREREGDGWKEK